MIRQDTPNIVVVGAGIVGCSTAYYLAKEGFRVTVIDYSGVASHASGFALGSLNPLGGVGIPEPLGPLSLASFRLHNNLASALAQATDIDTQFRKCIATTVALSDMEMEILQLHLPWQQSQEGFSVAWADTKEILTLEPRLSPSIKGGVIIRDVCILDSYNLSSALKQAAEQLGANFRHGSVLGVSTSSGQLREVHLTQESLMCEAMVVATGPRASEAGGWLGLEIPISPLKGQILHLYADGPPYAYVSWNGSYVVSKADGMVWVGTTEEDAGYDETPTQEAQKGMMNRAIELFPSLAGATLVKQSACLRPVAADGLPILGLVPGIERIVVATGGGRKGILLGPIMGKIAADLIANGTTDQDIAPFALERTVDRDHPNQTDLLRF
ncbi:MAG: hypothetical protein BZY82_01260 [SAR202 cluster bacterium Io17-Chloro-G3]|nr:MAG: hypothetical protein BZY82_01260 [SAR202 cluster bacterium Io17-Chloro-G3]